jgi:hypothetical protein
MTPDAQRVREADQRAQLAELDAVVAELDLAEVCGRVTRAEVADLRRRIARVRALVLSVTAPGLTH